MVTKKNRFYNYQTDYLEMIRVPVITYSLVTLCSDLKLEKIKRSSKKNISAVT